MSQCFSQYFIKTTTKTSFREEYLSHTPRDFPRHFLGLSLLFTSSSLRERSVFSGWQNWDDWMGSTMPFLLLGRAWLWRVLSCSALSALEFALIGWRPLLSPLFLFFRASWQQGADALSCFFMAGGSPGHCLPMTWRRRLSDFWSSIWASYLGWQM